MLFDKKLLSIDIGGENIKLVEGKYENDKVTVSKCVTIETPEGCFNDGNINNIITIKKCLEEALKENKLKNKNVVFTTKSTSVITRIIEIPWVKTSEAESVIKFEIEQYLPIDLEEYIIKYKILNEFTKDEVRMMRISTAVYPKTMAKMYWDLVKELKLSPHALDLNSNSITKLFTSAKGIISVNDRELLINDSTIAVIDMGHDQIELSIISNGVLEFTRILPGGGGYLDANIASQFAIDKLEAESRKIKHCDLNDSADDDYDEEVSKTKALNICVRMVVDRWIGEINRMLEYFVNRNRERQIQKVFIYGGTSELNGLSQYMQSSLGIPVERVAIMSNVVKEASAFEADIANYLNCIGSIIRLK